MAEPDRTNADAERVSDIVARLRREADGRDSEPDQFAEEVTADMRSAADIIEAQSKALAEARMVKPLKWQRSNVADRWTAWHPWGEYEIVRDQRDQKYRSPQFNAAGAYWNDLDQGQREIGEAHEKRVRSILSTPTPENPNG